MPELPAWKKSDNFKRMPHQRQNDMINALAEAFPTGDMVVEGTHLGRSIGDTRTDLTNWRAIAVVVAPETSDYEYDADDPRYRCKLLKLLKGTTPKPEDLAKFLDQDDIGEKPPGGTSPTESDPPEGPAIGWTVTATNLSEINDYTTGLGTHNVKEDETILVELFSMYDMAQPKRIRWFFAYPLESVGQYQYMVHQVVAQNVTGYEFVCAHSMNI